MPRNGSGQYSAPTNSWNPAINGVPATAADWQAVLNDIVSAMTQSVSRDGQTAMTGNLPMAGNKVTGLGNATASGDALTFAQLFSQGQQQDVPAAATTDIGAQLSTLINVTGGATITSFGTNYNGPRFLRFAGVCTLTNSATLVLPGGANITTAEGYSCIAVPLGNPATGWRVAGTGDVSMTGDQTIGGVKTFSSQIVASGGVQGNVTGNAGTVTNGVYTTGDQTIAGVKTFSSAPVVPDDSFTFAKLQNIPTRAILGRATAGAGDVEALSVATATAMLEPASETVSGRVELADATEAAAGTDGTRALSPLRLRDALNATGSAPIYACRAWVNFNGTGTVAIRASGNVSSITDNGTGDYTVNFTTEMPDANYAVMPSQTAAAADASMYSFKVRQSSDVLTTSVRLLSYADAGGTSNTIIFDPTQAYVAIFR